MPRSLAGMGCRQAFINPQPSNRLLRRSRGIATPSSIDDIGGPDARPDLAMIVENRTDDSPADRQPSRPHALVGLMDAPACPRPRARVRQGPLYQSIEFKIPMRDGVRLFTSVYVPKDESKLLPHPLEPDPLQRQALRRRPVEARPRAASRPSARPGYIFAYQDVRGRWMSEGVFVNMRPIKADVEKDAVDESTDTFDTIDWLVKNVPNNNGKVGQSGISYPGFYTACGLVELAPGLESRITARRRVLDWFVGRRLPPQRGVVPAARLQFPGELWPPSAVSRPARPGYPVRPRDARRLRLLPQDGAAPQRRRPLLQGRRAVLG